MATSEFASNSNFLYLAWERLVNIGTANMDLEINQNVTAGFTGTTTGPVTLNRTAGDLLVTYDFLRQRHPDPGPAEVGHQRGDQPVLLGQRAAVLGQPGQPVGGRVRRGRGQHRHGQRPGSAGRSSLPDHGAVRRGGDQPDRGGGLPARHLRGVRQRLPQEPLLVVVPAEVKDFIAPQPVNISNCGAVKIIKRTNPRGINQDFGFTSTIPNPPAGSTTPNCTADATPSSFTLNDNGNTSSDSAANTESCTNVVAGSYTVTEGSLPANFVLESLTCTATGGGSGSQDATNPLQANITVVPNSLVTCVYVDKQQLGAIKITKTSSKGTHPALAGATFSIESGGTPIPGSPFTTGNDGTVCVDHLPFGTYSVQETAAAPGYAIDDPTAHNVSVTATSTCGDGNEASFSATDTPLSKITVSFQSLAGPGVTTATIDCGGGVEPLPEGTPKVLNNLPPGTYSCTVVVDPVGARRSVVGAELRVRGEVIGRAMIAA